jgi:hypothetical protein
MGWLQSTPHRAKSILRSAELDEGGTLRLEAQKEMSSPTGILADILDETVAGRPVRDGLSEAIAAGKLVPRGDDAWSLKRHEATPSNWIRESRDESRKCSFKIGLMFPHIYRKRQVPAGCASCYKVKAVPRTLRELVALREVARALPYTYKCGLDEPTTHTSGIYGGYFFLNGLDAARAAYPRIREAIGSHPKLDASMSVFIKRGCTEYELACGPSDRYTFTPKQVEIESALLARVKVETRPEVSPMAAKATFTHWIRTAYRLGDETYLDFTGGRRLYPAAIRYEPEPAPKA